MAKRPYPIDPELVAVIVAYNNPRLIADDVLPRVPVGKEDFKYLVYPKGQMFTLPDNKVGRRGQPTEVHFEATEETASTEDYGLDDTIPQKDIDNAPQNHDPVAQSVEGLTALNMLAREKRTADLVFDATNYATGNKVQLSGTDQWSDYANSDPIGDIDTALDTPIMRPNKVVMGYETWSILRKHPDIIQAIDRNDENDSNKGKASRAEFAELFELEEIHVGQGYVNTAKPGQDVSLSRVWGNHFAAYYQDMTATTRNGITFGYTAQFGDPIAAQWDDRDIGLDGGVRIRAGEKVKELLTANDLGYFIEDAVA